MTESVTTRDVALPPGEDSVQVQPLLDPMLLLEALRETQGDWPSRFKSCTLEHVRYRPGRSCTAAYSLTSDDPDEDIARIYARSSTVGHFRSVTRDITRRSWRAGRILPRPLLIEPWRVMACEFPNDARLTGLDLFDRPKALEAALRPASRQPEGLPSRLGAGGHRTLLRYKPESRCVAQFELKPTEETGAANSLLLRFEDPRKFGLHSAVTAGAHGRLKDATQVGTPACVATSAEHGITVQAWIDGERLNDVLRSDATGQSVFRTGAALAAWHAGDPRDLPLRGLDETRSRMGEIAAELAGALPDEKHHLQKLAERLQQIETNTVPSPRGMLHGDFHPGQVLADGRRIWFLDVDGICAGETAFDIGNFLAQVRLQLYRGHVHPDAPARELFLEGYRAGGGAEVSRERLALFSALAYVELAHKQFRRLRVAWPERAALLLRFARGELDG